MATISTRAGRLAGVDIGGVERFLNIPYAAPLTGARRYREAEPRDPWTGTRDATRPGPTSPQWEVSSPLHGRIASPGWLRGDDVLSVNVWTPDRTGEAPVAVWIYGGAFKEGNAALPMYDGTAFARSGIVLVTVNYRVGVEGFLPIDGSINRGLRDQLRALEWVRDNIADFGGDPGRVTIFGQSAGGMSVASLVATPSARGLFHAAINQSGPLRRPADRADGEATTRALAAICGVEPTAEGFATVDQVRLLQEASRLTGTAGGALSPGPFTLGVLSDPDLVPWHATGRREDRFASRVPVLAGFTSDEFLLFGWPDPDLGDDEATLALERHGLHGTRALEAARQLFPDLSAGTIVRKLGEVDFFIAPVVQWLEDAAALGLPAWGYEFAWRTRAFDGAPGAYHDLEIPFVFNLLDAEPVGDMTGPHPPQELADRMHADWVEFFRTGELARAPFSGGVRGTHRYGGESRSAVFHQLYLENCKS
ncbi:carboxylesterase/lipase family protein [Microbacterium album]|uniref:Carboxylic ester hydrolase n=1 Tax=Microbacterium album TaxID=2053191 RepID=A0A917IHW0_9MICO|nr:carboxylesterase family protein [Microbacterium album]GGH48589.1 carboxylic ester hydrolase [Microbacterium album]